jgi:hypothetical protein
MKVKDKHIHQIELATESMIQGSLSELTRRCGDPSCACFRDPTRRHGPHLYLMFKAQGKTHSVYVLPQQAQAIKSAHAAWLRFLELGSQISADNREQFLRDLEREKQQAKAMKIKARSKLRD